MLRIEDFQGADTTVFFGTKTNGYTFKLNLKGGFLKSEMERTDSLFVFYNTDLRIMQDYPKQ